LFKLQNNGIRPINYLFSPHESRELEEKMSKFALTRRNLLAGFIVLPLVSGFAFAKPGDSDWDEGFEEAINADNYPVLSPQTVGSLENAIKQYQEINNRGGWPQVPNQAKIKIGSKRPAVLALRDRLVVSGDLNPAAGRSDVFDSYVEEAVRKFQTRHGLYPDGEVKDLTFAALNVPVETRLRQLETNLVRVRSMSGFLGNRYIVHNIPAAQLEAVEDGQVVSRHVTVVGKKDRQSPIISTKVSDINFNPFWTVPASIIKKDLIPKMQTEPDYLTKNKIRIFSYKTGQEVTPESINWNSMEATQYRFRQDTGEQNSMGAIRINIPNVHSVYMHDTPSKGLFGENARFHSSGCARVQNVRELVAWILAGTQWSRSEIDRVMRSGDRIDGKPKAPVPVYWVYITAWGNPDGLVQFRDDIYDRDGLNMSRAG
jgi:L,D-transpeptidase YcbB